MALRTIMIGHELGYREYTDEFDALAGSTEEREAKVLEIKEGVIAICGQHGGILIDEDRENSTDRYPDDDGNLIDVERLEWIEVTIEFPDRRAARLAGRDVLDQFEIYGVRLDDRSVPDSLKAHFLIVENQDGNTMETIQRNVADICDRLGAELLCSRKFVSTGQHWNYFFLFESERDIETAITELRKLWSLDQLRCGWSLLPERFPEETSDGRDTDQDISG